MKHQQGFTIGRRGKRLEAVALHQARHEMSLQEAATASGMSVAALKTVTHRALKSLRKLIEKRGSNT
jgi:DNA-directed RNA polymerase specialized sigma24 family protein